MEQLSAELIDELLARHEPPCISIFMPTHRAFPPAVENPKRFRNLLKQAEEALPIHCKGRRKTDLLKPLRNLARDDAFWRLQRDGLAVFRSAGLGRTVQLQRPVAEVAFVNDSFHVKPLVRVLQFTDRFQVLCLTQRNVELYEGNSLTLDEIPLRNVPRTLVEALGAELTEPHQTVASYGGLENPAMRHGHGGKKDEADIDLERFFRAVDRAIWENHSRHDKLPLMLCAVEHYHDRFARVSHNPYLMDEGIPLNPDSITIDRLHEVAVGRIEPFYRQRIAQVADQFRVARSRQLGSDNVTEVAHAATQARVAAVLVDEKRHIGGRIDQTSGQIQLAEPNGAPDSDLLDDILETVMKTGGQALVVPPDQMPTDTGIAAIYRF